MNLTFWKSANLEGSTMYLFFPHEIKLFLLKFFNLHLFNLNGDFILSLFKALPANRALNLFELFRAKFPLTNVIWSITLV